MVPPAAINARRLWTDPELLADLLDELREQGYNIGLDQYAVVQDLIAALIARGEDISQTENLRRWLGPVLCTSLREQENFPTHFDRWAARCGSDEGYELPVNGSLRCSRRDRLS